MVVTVDKKIVDLVILHSGQRVDADAACQVGNPHELVVVVGLFAVVAEITVVVGVVVGFFELVAVTIGIVVGGVVRISRAAAIVLTGDIGQVGGNGDVQLVAVQADTGKGCLQS